MSEDPDHLDAYIDAAAKLLRLPLDPAWKQAVRTNLEVTLTLASKFEAFALPDESEQAPIYKA